MSDPASDSQHGRNRLVAASCLAFFGSMVGAAYASVPLYAMFCQMTGYGGTTQRVEQASEVVLDKTITVRFDANVAAGMAWTFQPEQRAMTMKIGETVLAKYRAGNLSNRPTAGRAAFNVTPELAGAYFNKLECFCFTDTKLKPGESLDMPVVFFVDPDIVNAPELKDIKTITLSYTFFPIAGDEVSSATVKTPKPDLGG